MRCANNLQKCGLENLGREAADRADRADASRKLSSAAAFCLFFMLVEVVGGLYANSLAVLTDAAHLLTDIAGFAISLFAIWATSWESTAIQSYGFFRLEILGALVSIQFIWLMTGMLLYEATGRLVDSENDAVDGKVMFVVAMLGLFVNIIMIAVLGHDGHSHGHSGSHGGHEHHEAHDHHTGEEELEVDVRNPNGGGGDHHEHHENHGHGDESTEHAPRRAYGEHGEHAEHALVCTGHTMSTKVDEHRVDKHEHAEHASRKSKAKVSHDTNLSAKTISLHQRRQSNINVEGAYLHVLGDLIQSIGVITDDGWGGDLV